MMAKRTPVPYEAALSIAEDWARHWLIDNATEGHIAARWKVIHGVLTPPASDRPLINNEDWQADYDGERAKALIDRALHEQDADALNRKIIDIAQRNVSSGFDLAKSLAGAKNLAEMVELQAAAR
jgi:Phasin protein